MTQTYAKTNETCNTPTFYHIIKKGTDTDPP